MNAETFTNIEKDDDTVINYCATSEECNIKKGVDIVKEGISDIEKDKKFSQYIQDIVAYAITFVAILGVIFIIYAGFTIIINSGGDETKIKKAKTIILYVAIGIVTMFLAYSIVNLILKVINTGQAFRLPTLIESVYAETGNNKNTFNEYKNNIEILTSQLERDYKINGEMSLDTLQELQDQVTASINTFPDNSDFIFNNNLAQNLLISIEIVKKKLDSDNAITELAKNLKSFIDKIKIPKISAKIIASPSSGNAPLTASLRAVEVIDTSGVVIPKQNYIWWIKNSNGTKNVIATGPSTSYTFKEERTYIVNLDIISASKNQKGKTDVLPYNGNVKINVEATVGSIILYIDGNNVSDVDRFKITPTRGKKGVILDATASQAAGGSRFLRTSWDFGNNNATAYSYGPRIEKQYYSVEGFYKIRLLLTTNEDKKIVKDIELEVRDPIASIKFNKSQGYVGEDFKFNVNTTYTSLNTSYEWKIVSLSNNQIVYTSSDANISYKFKTTGDFQVRLKSYTPNGREDIDTVNVKIETRDPIANFSFKVTNNETPNIISLDATTSYDIDTFDSSKLKFKWIIDGQEVNLDSPNRQGSLGKYTFNTLGVHRINLEVTNQDGKASTVKKDIDINSLLSVKLKFSPKIVQIGNMVNIFAESKEAVTFEWNFGDGNTDITNNGRVSHSYKKSGTYNVKLTVRGNNSGDSNSITRKVYVKSGNSPFALITVQKDREELIASQDNTCGGKEAFLIDRASAVTFSSSESININGSSSGLSYFWKYLNKNSSKKNLTYKFDELGCFPVSLTVKSQSNGSTSTYNTYVKVENIPPKISGLTITSDNLQSDPVIVKVSANNPVDKDGVIISYLWYYYTDFDPEPQDYRITKTSLTTFVLPKITGKYYFVLVAEDSNGAKINTDEDLDNKYSISLLTDNINTPIIKKLTLDKTAIAIGDEINFQVGVSDIIGRDISSKCEYKWDFNGDGFYEQTTNSPRMTYKYSTPGDFTFKVKVSYKGISNTRYQKILVQNVLRPNFEYFAVGSKLIIFNTTQGLYNSVNWSLGDTISSSNPNYFVYDFGENKFPEFIKLKVSDNQTTKEAELGVKKDIINKLRLSRKKEKLIYFTYPNINKANNSEEIHLTNSADKLFIYLGESKGSITKYCIDADINTDTDLNGTTSDDCDNKGTESYSIGAPFLVQDLNNRVRERTIRLSIYEGTKVTEYKDIKIFLDYISNNTEIILKENKDISATDKIKIEELKNLIKQTPEKERLKMMEYFSQLQENWLDDREKTKIIIDFETYVNSSFIEQKIKDQLYNLLEGFLVSQGETKNEITLATNILKKLIPTTNPSYLEIVGTKENPGKIDEILSHPTNTQLNKELAKFILEAVKNDSNISNKDKILIKSQLEVIIYGGQKNVPAQSQSGNEEISTEKGTIVSFLIAFLKLFGYLILVGIAIIIGLFVYFKLNNKNENLSFQDFIIERFLREKKRILEEEKKEEIKKPDVLSTISTTQQTQEQIPTITEQEENNEKGQNINDNLREENISIENEDDKIPDWLKKMDQSEINNEVEEELTGKTEEVSIKDYEEIKNSEEANIENEDDKIPDWLKKMDQSEINNEVEEELTGKTEEVSIKDYEE
ncbi:PKD domain-containing protein, partial [Candidatus Gracilibacteria bacterium]|nr:PKD domain-containing protein [Candidatus Gracilibacteria bacterium]